LKRQMDEERLSARIRSLPVTTTPRLRTAEKLIAKVKPGGQCRMVLGPGRNAGAFRLRMLYHGRLPV
jgi:hypothetical protein